MMARNCPAQANGREAASAEACCGHVPLAGGAAGSWGVLGATQNFTSKCCPAASRATAAMATARPSPALPLLSWPRWAATKGFRLGSARPLQAPGGHEMLHKQPDNSNQTTRPKGHKDPENQVFYQKILRKGFFSASYQLKHVGQKRSYA